MLDTEVPDFSLPATGGPPFNLAAQAGKMVVIYFYPKDSTPGCTTEGQNFRDLHDAVRRRRCRHSRHLARQPEIARELQGQTGPAL